MLCCVVSVGFQLWTPGREGGQRSLGEERVLCVGSGRSRDKASASAALDGDRHNV